MSTGGNICCFYGETIMVKHFNTYDVYQHSNFNIYSAKDMQYLDKLHPHCRYMFLEYLIDHNDCKCGWTCFYTQHKTTRLLGFDMR